MNWLRDKIRKWLGADEDFRYSAYRITANAKEIGLLKNELRELDVYLKKQATENASEITLLQSQIKQLRTDLNDCMTATLELKDLRDRLNKRLLARQDVFRIHDFESATQEALSEFKEEKNVISRN